MHSEAVRDLRWMVFGAAFMTTGSVFYFASTPVLAFIRTLGFPLFIVELVALVAGFVGEPPSRWIRQ
jgi:hypothetical protein